MSADQQKKDKQKSVRRLVEACITAAACTYLGITVYRKMSDRSS